MYPRIMSARTLKAMIAITMRLGHFIAVNNIRIIMVHVRVTNWNVLKVRADALVSYFSNCISESLTWNTTVLD